MPYFPSRQNEIIIGIRTDDQVEGIRRRFGIFNETDGMFLEEDSGIFSAVLRRNTASGVVENRVTLENWSVDRLDGTGPSGYVVDLTLQQIVVIEYEWFGAGQVEFALVIDNNKIPFHQFDTANFIDNPFTTTPYLPLRTEITNTGSTEGRHDAKLSAIAFSIEGAVETEGNASNA